MSSRNATASWSGYLHQGKVGILVGLRKINKLIEEGKELSEWVIEYESAEDIDVKHGEKVVSRHQVKAYKNAKYPNDYKDVLGLLDYKMINGKNKRVSNGFQICKFDENAQRSMTIEVDEGSRFLHTITETRGFDLSKEEFEDLYRTSTYVENPNNIQLYEYPDGRSYCELSINNNKLKDFCIAEFNKVLTTTDHKFKDSEEFHENIFYKLVDSLDEEIRKKHILGPDQFPVLKLSGIYNTILDTGDYKRENIRFLREKFTKSWIEFIEELNINSIPYNKSQENYVENIVSELYKMDNETFVQFIKDINPDKNKVGNIDTIEDVTDLCKPESLKDIFFDCLINVTKEKFKINYNGFKKDGGYLLTLINRRPTLVRSIINSIIANPGITKGIYERRYLINDKIDGVSFKSIIGNTVSEDNLEKNWHGLASSEDNFINPKMEFITSERAKEYLNKGGKT